MNPLTHFKRIRILPLLIAPALVALASPPRSATLPPGNTVHSGTRSPRTRSSGSGTFQAEGFIYMALRLFGRLRRRRRDRGRVRALRLGDPGAAGASADAAVVEAAYRTLVNYFPARRATLGRALRRGARVDLRTVHAPKATRAGCRPGSRNDIIYICAPDDGRMTPIGVTSSFPTLPPGPGVWRLTPPFAPPQTPWVGSVRPFILQSVDQFLPDPPPSLQSDEWVDGIQPDQGLRRGDQQRADTSSRPRSRSSGRRTSSASTTASRARSRPRAASACSRRRGWPRW